MRVILDLVALFVASEHHQRRPAHHQREDHFHVWPKAQQAGADGHENPAEHNRPQNAPVQHPVTIFIRHPEPGENRHHHEQVINREHLFQRITGEEQTRHLCAVVNVQKSRESHSHHDPKNGPHRGAFQRNRFVVTVHEEVDKHRPHGHHNKDNDGFRRETEMSRSHDTTLFEDKYNPCRLAEPVK